MPKTVGRSDGAKRYPLNMRTTEAVRKQLEEAATASGRSLAQEVEARLSQSFAFEASEIAEFFKAPLIRMLSSAVKQAELEVGDRWYKSADAAARCRSLILGVMDLMLPPLNRLTGDLARDAIGDQMKAVDVVLNELHPDDPEAALAIRRVREFHAVAERLASRQAAHEKG